MFRDREDGAQQLADRMKWMELRDPLVLGIPRGGVLTGAVLARELGAELDVVISRKLRAPMQPEVALGAVAENGEVYLSEFARSVPGFSEEYLDEERRHQIDEITRRKELFRVIRPAAVIDGRSVIVTDDGIATGATMIAALHVLKSQQPYEVIVAVPVSSPDRLEQIRPMCDKVVCLLSPESFWAVGQFYQDFNQVSDDEAVELLRQAYVESSQRKQAPCAVRPSRQGV